MAIRTKWRSTVAEILGKVNETTEGYVLLEEKNDRPRSPLPARLSP